MPLDELRTAFRTALNMPAETSVDDAKYGETAGWDSVAHMALVAEIESVFDVMLDTDQVIGLSSFNEAERILAEQGIRF
jgi:acyl carrier protein